MLKETRYNLIFLSIVIAMLLPGAVILFRKKMEPDARRMDMPDAVPRTIAFMDRQQVPPGMRRIAPARTMDWLSAVTKEKAGEALCGRMLDPDGLPLMSDAKAFQVVAVRNESDRTRIWIAAWDQESKDFLSAAKWTLTVETHQLRPIDWQCETIQIPSVVRNELGENGLLKPPKTINWCMLEFCLATTGSWHLRGVSNALADEATFVPSFTNPYVTKK